MSKSANSSRSRYENAAKLRAEGLTYKKIGEILGRADGKGALSATRARQMVAMWGRIQNKQKTWYDGLSPTAANCLRSSGYESASAVQQDIGSGVIRMGDIPGLGAKTYADICKWLGVEQPEPKRPSASGINKAIAFLEKHGYKITPPK